ncbi:MAG TPA: hypothetical protein V6C81_20825 [Planktothrix sp.]|jgi:hypothetical protein
MSELQVSSVQKYSMSASDSNRIDTTAPARAFDADSQEPVVEAGRSWKELLQAAKRAHQVGDETESTRLYRLGLGKADKELGGKNEELVKFLRSDIWG